jgi:hypothetical protein
MTATALVLCPHASHAERRNWSKETKTAPGGRSLKCIASASSIPWAVSAKAAFNLGVHIFEAEQLGECVANGFLIKSVQAAQDPAGFK